MKIGILTHQNGYNRGSCDFYPLIKWKNEFKANGIEISFHNSHLSNKLLDNDIVIIDHRYYRRLIVIIKQEKNKTFIVKYTEKLKKLGIKVILFDNGDGAGGRQWDMIEYVDILVKKQLLKDRSQYTYNNGKFSYMVFLDDYYKNDSRKNQSFDHSNEYTPCPANQLQKIRLGWNIGMLDYRKFPLSRFYPFGTNRLLNSLYRKPKFHNGKNERIIDSSFRGTVNNDFHYSFQRNKVIKIFNEISKYNMKFNLVSGGFANKNKYINEIRKSKTCVSPFGWGEVCYRDFEAIINGAVLIKPSMVHIDTYPDIYKENETYIPLMWDMSDFEQNLLMVLDNYDIYNKYVFNAQKIYQDYIINSSKFIKHFKAIIN